MKYETFCDIFGRNAETQFAYNIIFNALKRIENSIVNENEQQNIDNALQTIIFKDAVAGGISRKAYYNLINQKPIISVKRDLRTKF